MRIPDVDTIERSEADGFTISTDRARLDRDLIHRYLNEVSYWAKGIPRDVFERSIDNALPFGVYAADGRQVGFARVITDYATFGYVGDVFVLEDFRGRGLSKRLMDAVFENSRLQGLRRWMIIPDNVNELYRQL